MAGRDSPERGTHLHQWTLQHLPSLTTYLSGNPLALSLLLRCMRLVEGFFCAERAQEHAQKRPALTGVGTAVRQCSAQEFTMELGESAAFLLQD